MFEDPQEIIQAVNDKEADFEKLRTRQDDDLAMIMLAEFEAKKGYKSYTSSAPKNFYEKVLDGVNRAALTLQIKLPDDADEEQKRSASENELFLFGAFAAIDRRLIGVREPVLRQGLASFMCIRGWFAMRALVYLTEGDETVFDVMPWDPIHTYSEVGSNGLIWAANKRKSTRAQIEDEYSIDISGKEATIIDFFTKTHNSVVIIDSGEFAKEPDETDLDHVPVIHLPIGSMPTMQNKDFESQLEHQGDSIMSSARGLVEPRNSNISMIFDMAERSRAGSILHRSSDGTKSLAGDPYRSYQEIKLEAGETIEVLQLPEPPAALGIALEAMQQDWQQSTLPFPLAFGGTEEAMSGRALSVLADATRSVFTPRTGGMAVAFSWLAEELLGQFAENGADTELTGYDARDEFFQVTSKPGAIDPSWFVDVQVHPRLPRDREAEVLMAQMATQSRGPDRVPLVSDETAREEYLKLRNPQDENDKVLTEMGEALPPIRAINIAAALKRKGKDKLAEQVTKLLIEPEEDALPPEGGNGAGGEVPNLTDEEMQQIVDAVGQALIEAGENELAQNFQQALQSGQPAPPELVNAIVQVLVRTGNEELANRFLQALGVQPRQQQSVGV